MRRHIDLTRFEKDYPFMVQIGGYGKRIYVLDLWKCGLHLNGEQIADLMERLAERLDNLYFDGRVYRITAEADRIVIESKF